MKKYIFNIIIIFIITPFVCGVVIAKDNCYTCHISLGDKPSSMYKHDIHFIKGISCAGCHGGNPNEEDMEKAMDKKAGFKGKPKGDDISRTCASCHSSKEKMNQFKSELYINQWEMLQKSVHGKLSLSGKEQIVQCITCHSVHEIVSVKDPASPVYPLKVVKTCSKCHSDMSYMRKYNPSLPTDQYEKYQTSMHGKLNAKGDAKPAVCFSCHGSHDILSAKEAKSKVYATNLPMTCSKCHSDAQYMKGYNIPTDQFEKFSKSVHGIALLQKKDLSAPACNKCHGNHGANPPEVESISKVCGTCHVQNSDLFSSSPHKKAFDEKNLPECETCHGKHEIISSPDRLLGVSKEAVCSQCHKENENSKGYFIAMKMRQLIDSLESSEKSAKALINEAEQKGMEISEAKFKVREAHQARLQSRTMVHSFNEEKFRSVVDKGIEVTKLVYAEAKHEIDEYYFRRIGLGLATLIISIVAISLYFTIKRIEKKQRMK